MVAVLLAACSSRGTADELVEGAGRPEGTAPGSIPPQAEFTPQETLSPDEQAAASYLDGNPALEVEVPPPLDYSRLTGDSVLGIDVMSEQGKAIVDAVEEFYRSRSVPAPAGRSKIKLDEYVRAQASERATLLAQTISQYQEWSNSQWDLFMAESWLSKDYFGYADARLDLHSDLALVNAKNDLIQVSFEAKLEILGNPGDPSESAATWLTLMDGKWLITLDQSYKLAEIVSPGISV